MGVCALFLFVQLSPVSFSRMSASCSGRLFTSLWRAACAPVLLYAHAFTCRWGRSRGGGEVGVLPSIPVAPLRPIKRRAARLRGWLAQSSSLSLSPQRSAHLRPPPPSHKPRLFPQTYDGMHCSQRLRLKRFYPTQIPVLGIKLCLLWGYGSKTSTVVFTAQQKSTIFVRKGFQLLLS